MMNSTTLQITTQPVGDETLLGVVSTGVFRPLVPIQHREVVSSRCMPYTIWECRRPDASSPPGSAGHRWPRLLPRWPGLAYTASEARFTDTYAEIPVPHHAYTT
jgi:hypothetical protein